MCNLLPKQKCPFLVTGWAKIESKTGERNKVIMSAFWILAFYPGNALLKITTFQEFFDNLRDPVGTVISIDLGIFLVIDFPEFCKVVFEQGLQNILAPWYIFLTWISVRSCSLYGNAHRK